MITITRTKSAALLLLAGSVGCSQKDYFAQWDDRELADQVAELSEASSHDVRNAPPKAYRLSSAKASPEDAGVAWYIDAAIRHNPEVRAARQRVERLRERVPQATRLPNPMASVTFGDLAETAAGQVEYIVGVQQSLPFPGTLDARGEVARQEVMEALHGLEVVVDRTMGDTARAYWSHDGATREIAVLEANRELLNQIDAAVRARIRVGQSGQANLLRVSRELAALDNQLSELERRQTTSAAMLRRLTGFAVSIGSTATDASQWATLDVDAEALREQAMRNSPRVAAAQARMGTYRERLSLARMERLPDFVLGVQYGAVRDGGLAPSANGDDQIAGTIGVSIPLWAEADNAGEREALRGIGEALAEAQAAQDSVAFEVEEAVARIEAGQQTLSRLRDRMMPDAQQVIDVALASYRTGGVDLLSLLDDWQVLLMDQMQEARVLTDLHRAAADLTQATGVLLDAEVPQTGDEP
ncbi:MAG: TolC family protein [Planctomycetota bacterium]